MGKVKKSGEQAVPKVGDLGKIDNPKDVDETIGNPMDQQTKKDIGLEESALNVRDTVLEQLIKDSKIELNEE